MLLPEIARHYLTPNRRTLLFATKGFAAVTLALAISMSMDLDKPFWAVVASMMLQARPETGLVIEKAAFLFLGTVAGALFSGVLISIGVHDPMVAFTGLAIIVATTSMVAATLRHVNFVFGVTLIGVSTALITLFSMADVATVSSAGVFSVMRARVLEVAVGASSATVVSLLLFPWKVDGILKSHVHTLIETTLNYGAKVLSENLSDGDSQRLASSVLRGAAAIRDDSNAGRYEEARSVKASLFLAFQAITAVSELSALRANLARGITGLSETTIAQLARGRSLMVALPDVPVPERAVPIRHHRAEIKQLLSSESASVEDVSVLMALDDVFKTFGRMHRIRRAAMQGQPVRVTVPRFASHRDPIIGLIAATRTLLAFSLAAGLWIVTGGGPGLVMMMVLPVLFAQMFAGAPDPTMVVRRIIVGAVIAIPLAAAGGMYALSAATGHFELLVLVLAGPMFLGLMGMMNPHLMPSALGFCLTFAVLIQPSNYMAFSVSQSITTGLGIVAGLTLLLFSYELIPRPSGLFLQRRVLKQMGIALLGAGAKKSSQLTFTPRMGELVLSLVGRGNASPQSLKASNCGLAALELGQASLAIHGLLASTPTGLSQETNLFRDALGDAYFAALRGQRDLGIHFAAEALINEADKRHSPPKIKAIRALILQVHHSLKQIRDWTGTTEPEPLLLPLR
ncbi:FUSC family protein [Stenotrophomonas maltophilia]|uniref:FUSC family protein n=1 Tax=Stenotrophomonas TaxID=40323 RepID=UPI0018D2AF15|nr:FUSC family protein [Stenotrophomonas maltophilia]MBH1816826.1 FUSC family protein [Stenotrophomonas maltophilia]MCU1029713.1 FUSC family protein [Stenotrophomonas maltophilia]